jgi:cold shock CspA family protein
MRTTGTVEWLNESRGIGFITPEAGQKAPAAERLTGSGR